MFPKFFFTTFVLTAGPSIKRSRVENGVRDQRKALSSSEMPQLLGPYPNLMPLLQNSSNLDYLETQSSLISSTSLDEEKTNPDEQNESLDSVIVKENQERFSDGVIISRDMALTLIEDLRLCTRLMNEVRNYLSRNRAHIEQSQLEYAEGLLDTRAQMLGIMFNEEVED